MSQLSTVCSRGLGLVREIASFRPRQLGFLLALMLLSGVTEAFSFALLVPLLVLTGVVTGPPAGAAGSWLAHLAGLGGAPSLEGVLALFLLAVAVRAVVSFLSGWISADYVGAFIHWVRCRIYTAHSRASWLFLSTASASRDSHALTGVAEEVGHAVVSMLMLVSAIVMATSGLLVALLLSPRMTMVVLVGAIGLVAPLAWLHVGAYRRGEATLYAARDLYDLLSSRLGGFKLAKAFAIERELERDFVRASSSYQRSVMALKVDHATARLFQDLASGFVLVVFAYASVRVFSVPSVELVLLIVICARILPLVGTVQLTLRSLASSLPHYEAVRAKELAAEAAAEPLPLPTGSQPPWSLFELERIRFSYPSDLTKTVIDDVSLRIAAHQSVGIVGASGSGKSTIADILAGLIVPDHGRLVLDGLPLDSDRRAAWRSSVAYVPQDAPLFHDTVFANLSLGAIEAEEAEVWQALESVGAAELIRSLPGGLSTVVGDRGVRFSGGQRQRLRLASALLRRPRLLILDEATNALSALDEQAIVTSLSRYLDQMTIVVIAHQASSVAWTDQLHIFEQGRVVASGPTQPLLERAARYLSAPVIAASAID